MASDVKLNIQRYREASHLTQEQLGKKVGVTRQTISAWERGDSTPTVAQLLALAKALGVEPDLLLGGGETSDLVLLFRADNPEVLVPGLRDTLTRKSRDYADLERLLNRVPVLPESRPLADYEPETVEAVAQEVRDWLGAGERPLHDGLSLIEDKGIKVLLHPLPDQISGFSAYTDEIGAVIFINQGHPRERQSFTAFHELAHLIFHRDEYRKVAGTLSKNDPKEKTANHFAGAVLLPRDMVWRELRFYRGRWIPEMLLADMKLRYGVSMRTVLVRAYETGVITKAQMGKQIGALNKKYGKDQEPVELPQNKMLTRLTKLVFAALVEEKITVSRAAEILGRPLLEIREELENGWRAGN